MFKKARRSLNAGTSQHTTSEGANFVKSKTGAFLCKQCGACCRDISANEHLRFMADESGCCIFLKENLCSIYETRPLFCRVEEAYAAFYSDVLSHDQYIEYTENACRLLRMKEANKSGDTVATARSGGRSGLGRH